VGDLVSTVLHNNKKIHLFTMSFSTTEQSKIHSEDHKTAAQHIFIDSAPSSDVNKPRENQGSGLIALARSPRM
jgi:hypothetical protein